MHYPTDLNLLYDALRKVITLTARWCADQELSDWRQYRYNIRHLKRLLRAAQNKKRSQAQAAAQQARGVTAHQNVALTAPDLTNQGIGSCQTARTHAFGAAN